MTPEQLEGIAIWLEQNHPATGDAYIPVLEAASILKEHAAVKRQRQAIWYFDAWTQTLIAGDPGAVHLPRMTRVPDFAALVPIVLEVPGAPCRLPVGGMTRAAVHAARDRTARRLEQARQRVLVEAVGEIVLEQTPSGIYATYEPEALPITLLDYPYLPRILRPADRA